MHVAGYVLVGGCSSRMGHDKARLRLPGHLLLVENVAAKVQKIAGNVTLVGNPAAYRDLAMECLPDLRSGKGPLAGIESALAAQGAELNLIVACDMPDLKSEWLAQLLAAAEASDRQCVVAEDLVGCVHPLCAVYRSTCLPVVRAALADGHLRLMDLIDSLSVERVKFETVIRNVNTPEEWESWCASQTELSSAAARVS
ncbi:MAG: molybdenum cofactor guanylyltransferase [Acidobacteriaceae bacterium]|nr:molybdenum cofactor guanylyltransferase [Acidobacteriaceae bacterium]